MKSLFEVKPVGPAFNPAVNFVRVEAASPKNAAEQVIGRELGENGDPSDIRAIVKVNGREVPFYLPSATEQS